MAQVMSKPIQSAPYIADYEKVLNDDVIGSYTYKTCYWNAEKNAETVFKDKGLKRVCGSLVLANAWAYGSPNKKHNYKKNPSNSHCWLEDAEGNVYDYCQPFWDFEVRQVINPKDDDTPYLPLGVEFRGASKNSLKALGMEYIPAPEATQQFLFAWAKEGDWMMKMLASMPWKPIPVLSHTILAH
jgi:hypothetical protein